MRIFFVIFYILISGSLLFSAEKGEGASGKNKAAPASQFKNFHSSRERLLSAVFASRVRTILKSMIPQSREEIFCMMVPDRTIREPQLRKEEAQIIIRIPADFGIFIKDRRKLQKITAWAVLAAAGLPPENEKRIENAWFTAGITHRAFYDVFLRGLPYSDHRGGICTLAGNHVLPDLKQVLSSPLFPETAAGELYGEYCDLLLIGCLRGKLFSGEQFSSLIRRTVLRGENRQYGIFQEELNSVLRRKKQTPEEWFRHEMNYQLTNSLMPCSVHAVETIYAGIVSVDYTDKDNRKKKCILPELNSSLKKMKHPEQVFSRLVRELYRLELASPLHVRRALADVRFSVQLLQKMPGEENQKRINEAEQKFFRAMEKQAAVDRFLQDTERMCVSPGTRFFRTLNFLEHFSGQKEWMPCGTRLNALLDSGKSRESLPETGRIQIGG